MLTESTSRFKMRGLLGVVLIASGIGLALVFKKGSNWPTEAKTLALAAAYCAAIGGAGLFSCCVQQLEFNQMQSTLIGLAVLLFTMLLLNL